MKKTKKIYKALFLTAVLAAGCFHSAFGQILSSSIEEFSLEPTGSTSQKNTNLPKQPKEQATPDTKPVKDKIASLRFIWNTPVNVAAFDRNGKIWIVFDQPNHVDTKALKKEADGLAKEIYTLAHPVGTVVIITPQDNVKYALRKEGLLWILDLYTGRPPQFKTQDLTIFTQYDSLKNAYLFVPTNYAGNTLSMIDPEIGDIISISTTSQLGLGFNSAYRYPDFDILPTIQGLAFVVNAPDIILNRGNSGITLKAMGRGLNITSDLDVLKRHQQRLDADNETSHTTAFDFQISQEMADKKFNDVVDDFKTQILAAPQDQKNYLRLKLAQYYIYQGLGTEALYIINQMKKLNLPETQTDKFYALSGVANFLARRYNKAVEDFSQGTLPNTTEGNFWLTIAKSAQEYREENNAVIFSHISLMKDYPQSIKDQIAIIAARNAIATNDDLSSQNFIDVLKSVPDRMRNLNPQITYLSAQKMEMQGYIRNAVKGYQSLLNSDSAMFSSYGRLQHTILSQMVNHIDSKTAIKELEKLRFAWGEPEFKIRLLGKLADFYLKDKDFYNALRVLQEQREWAPKTQKQNITEKMVKIFEDIFIGNHADDILTPIKSLALYQDFNGLAVQSTKHNLIIQKLSDRLVAVDLLPRARELLEKLLTRSDLTPENTAKVGARLAVISLFEGKPQDALNMIEATTAPDLEPETKNPRRLIAAKALSALGRPDEALQLLDEDYSPNALLHKFEVYWNAQDWDNASNTIKYLIEEPKPGQKLSPQQINYILDWATTLKQAGKETVLVRLRNKFMPYFKDTPYHSAFNVLTNHLEKEKIDIKAIHSIITDVQNFNNFAKFYTEALKESNLE